METIDLELIRVFVKVIECGGFTKAAEVLKVSKSSVSKTVTRLESITGTKLLVRSTRSHTLTAAGRGFYESSLGPVRKLEEAQKSLYESDSIISGKIRITATEDFGTHLIAPVLGDLASKHPQLNFELFCTNRSIDMIKDGFDLALRIGALRESSLISRKVGVTQLILVASPGYLKNYGEPTDVVELISHRCLSIDGMVSGKAWVLEKKDKKKHVKINIAVESNQMSVLKEAATADAGVFLAPRFLCQDAIDQGLLVHILKPWKSPGLSINLVSPVSISRTARLKVVADELVDRIKVRL